MIEQLLLVFLLLILILFIPFIMLAYTFSTVNNNNWFRDKFRYNEFTYVSDKNKNSKCKDYNNCNYCNDCYEDDEYYNEYNDDYEEYE